MKRTKTKLVSSIVTLLICFAMLVGSTFAWFTDSASTGVNKIQAGNLDVQLLAEDGATSLEGKTLKWVKAAGASVNEPVLWEPGATYYTQGFQIKNAGNLALKFKITINGTSGNSKLLEAINFYLSTSIPNGTNYGNPISSLSNEYKLGAGKYWNNTTDGTNDATTVYLVGHMKEDAGNEYQGLSLDNIGITLAATQDTVESDSFDSNYDERSIYPVIPTLNNTTLTGKITSNGGTLNDQNSPTAAQISVPGGAVTNDTNVVFSMQLTDSTADSTTYEINLKNVETGGSVTLSKPAVITANIGTDLTNVKVKHNDRDMTENATGEDGTYQYDGSTGILTIYTKTFSPFKITYKFDGVALLNGVAYPSINTAINAAKDDDTIVLLDNTSMTYKEGKSCISIDNKNITIDGNGKVITLIANTAVDKYGIYIKGSDISKTVTIKNATINTTNLERAIRTEGSIGVNIVDCTISTNGVGVHVKGSNKVDIINTKITVGVIDNEKYTAHLRTAVMVGGEDANVTVNGCTINAINTNKITDTKVLGYQNSWCKGLYVGSLSKNAKITANDTNVVADFSIAIDGAQNDDTQFEGKPTQIIINSGEYSGLFGSPSGLSYKSLIINGGTFTGIQNYNDFYGKDNDIAKLVISGGTFNVDPAAYVNSKYHSVNNGDGTYSIERTALAYIDHFKFSEIDGETTKELFSDSFDSDSNYEKYCPHHTGTNPNSTTHDGYVDTFAIEDGVAKIYSNSAWTNFYKGDMDTATAENIDVNKSYKLQYDVKIDPNYSKTDTNAKDTLTFNYGSWGGSWASDCLSFAKDSNGKLGIYDSTSSSSIGNKITDIEVDEFYTIETSFVPTLVNGQATKITVTTSIIIGTETKQINQFEFSDLGDTFNGYCWDIYFPAN